MSPNDWVVRRRHEGGHNDSRAHRVDRVLDDGVVTTCGRRLPDRIPTRPHAVLVTVPPDDRSCAICLAGGRA